MGKIKTCRKILKNRKIEFGGQIENFEKIVIFEVSGFVSGLPEMGASFCIEWDSRRRNRRDLKKMEKMKRIKKLIVILLSGHSWMPLGSIPGHPDASRSIPILVIGRGKNFQNLQNHKNHRNQRNQWNQWNQ